MFADDYPRFIELAEPTPEEQDRGSNSQRQRNRMTQRYEGPFAGNRTSSIGRGCSIWPATMARSCSRHLKTGAAHGGRVEVRQSLIDRAQQAFAFYGQDPETYRFVRGDVFEDRWPGGVRRRRGAVLRFPYHTFRPTELMFRLSSWPRGTDRRTIVTPETQRPILRMMREYRAADTRQRRSGPLCAASAYWCCGPRCSLSLLLGSYGFEIDPCTTGRAGWPADRTCLASEATQGASA